MNQKALLLKHLQTAGAITSREASALYGIDRVAARVHDLRKLGHEIKTVAVQGKKVGSRRKKTFARYIYMPKED